MLSGLISMLGAGTLGGVTGLLGGIVNRWADHKAAQERHKHEQAMADKDLEYLKFETERDVQVAREHANMVKEKAGLDAMAKSYESDRRSYLDTSMTRDLPGWMRGLIASLMSLVDFVRGMTRPALTIYLCVLTTLMYMQMHQLIGELGIAFDSAAAIGIIHDLVHAVIYLTTMAVGWWFATRTKKQE